MGSKEHEARRFIAASDMISSDFQNSHNSSRIAGRSRRGDAAKSGLALSGRTTTAKGHPIVPPTKARIIAFEYKDEEVEEQNDVRKSERTITLVPSSEDQNNMFSNGPAPEKNTNGRMAVTRYEFGNLGRGERYQSDGSRRVNNGNKTLTSEVDRSTVSRTSRIDRNHRSVSSATAGGNVTGTKNEVPPHVAALRQEYADIKRQNRGVEENKGQDTSQQGTKSEAGPGRRRRRIRTQPNESASKQNSTNRTLASGFNALGNSSGLVRRSPYLPTYIQPVIEENSSSRSSGNHMLYNNPNSSYAAQRNRKISTDMNRYESSPSSSSSSSESDEGSPNRPIANPVIKTTVRSQNQPLDTPDTSDAETKHPGMRRRRRLRTAVGARNEGVEANSVNKGEASSRGRTRNRHLGRTNRMRHNDIPPLDDKYVTLPDDFKQTVTSTNNTALDGDMAQLVETTNSHDSIGKDHSTEGKSLRTERVVRRDRDSRSATVTSGDTTVRENTSDSISSNSKQSELIIGKEQRLCYGKTLAVPPQEISLSEEHLVQASKSPSQIDFSVSSPNLDRAGPDSTRISSTENQLSEHYSRGGLKRRKSLGESKNSGYNRRRYEKNDASVGNQGFMKDTYTQRRIGGGSLQDLHEPSVVQSRSKIIAHKVGEDFWPRDEATEKLLSQSRTLQPTDIPGSNTALRTMQETIDQLHEFANNETTPLKSTSASTTSLNDYSRNYDEKSVSGDLKSQSDSYKAPRKDNNNKTAALVPPRVQTKFIAPADVSSPCMSSTETLKECGSSNEYHDKNSRSPSIDSTTSNPETNSAKDRTMHGKLVYGRSTPVQNKVELFIEEQASLKPDASANQNKSVLEVINDLTDTLKRIGKPQPLPSPQLETANVRVDTLMNVSPKGNVTCHPPRLETLSEDPEPPSPELKRVARANSSEVAVSKKVVGNPNSYLKVDSDRAPGDIRDNTTRNESTRSLSDPSAERMPPQQGESSEKDDTGSLDHTSCSSLSQFSEHPLSCNETLNIEELIDEETMVEETDDVAKSQKLVKKKSKSDPNPKGRDVTEAIADDNCGVNSASSEPNVTEQSDELGDLGQFKIYQKTKADPLQSPGKLQPIQEPILHAHVSPRIPKPKSKKHQIRNVGSNSIIGQLMSENSGRNYNEVQGYDQGQYRSSSTPSPMVSDDSSPVQKEGPETFFQQSEEQFMEVLNSMTSKPLSVKPQQVPAIHARSVSEPVPMDQVSKGSHASIAKQYHQDPASRSRRSGMIQAPSMDSVGIRYSTAETASLHSINEPPNYRNDDAVFTTVENGTQRKGKNVHDMRLHAFENLLETEKSYVNSLRILYEDYMTPLKRPENHSTCEPRLVDEMFYKIPQLFQHHDKFYENVQRCFEDWNYKDVRLGELFLNSFNKDALLDTYTAYITNYLNAREAVRTAEGKEAFKRFVEQCRSGNKDKQGLSDLMIKPVQRIPRYELLIKDMLKHTPEGHPDRGGLLIAQEEIHKLAVQMNRSEKEAEAAEKQDKILIDIELMIENLSDLCVPKRKFLRQDIVTEIQGATKKDRSIWLFSDLMVCSTRKVRGGTAFRRGSMMNLNMGQDRFANIDLGYKYKFLWKFPLEDVENLKGNTQVPGRHAVDRQLHTLENDMNIITNMQRQAAQIDCNHVQLDEALREIMSYVGRQMSEKKQLSLPPAYPPGRVELGISTGDGMKNFLFEFLTDDNKVQFEKLFASAKRSLTTLRNRWEPTFMKAIPISRTRAGMQFSCAASNIDASPDVKEVWVCNTDGYVGQVCFLTLEPEPNQTQCITVCQAKICCIAQVPAWERRLVPAQKLLQEVARGSLAPPHGDAALNIMSWDEDMDESDEENTESPHSTISSYGSYSPYGTMNGENMMSPDLVSLPGIGGPKDQNRLSDGAWQKISDGSTLHGSLEDLLQEGEPVIGDAQSILAGKDSMWLGTENGRIHIYPSSQSTRGSKHCVRLSHAASVHCILYHEGQVFVALSNGDLVVYTRNVTTGEWDFENQWIKSKVSSPNAITKMVVVDGKELWCGCQNLIKIINIKDVTETDHFAVINDTKRQIYCMVCCGYGVWVALDKKPQIKLYHTYTHDLLADIDVSNPVSKMLASADAIIRQHKAACLRITALLVCNDLLWVGTSAGVVLTLTLPKITPNTSALAMPVIPQGLAYGHTGHVRFLACAEIADKEQNGLSRGGSARRPSTTSGKRRTSSSSNANNQPRTVSIIISGGDGYEDFRMNSTSESAGRDDSTNHLLVWKA